MNTTEKIALYRPSLQTSALSLVFRIVRLLMRSPYRILPDPTGVRWLQHILNGPMAFQVVRTAVALGLFDLLKTRPGLTEGEILSALGRDDGYPLRVVLTGCVAVRALKKRNHRFYLVRPGVIDALKEKIALWHEIFYRQLFYMKESVEQRRPIGLFEVYGYDVEDIYRAKAKIAAIHEAWNPVMTRYSLDKRHQLLRQLDYSPYRQLVDVGSNDGELLVELARKYPDLRATALELPGSPGLLSCIRRIEASRMEDRIEAVGMDVFDNDLPAGADLVQFIHFVNMFAPDRNLRLLDAAWRALQGGGRVLIVGPMLDEGASGISSPEWALYSPVFLVCKTGEGQVYSIADVTGWLEAVGFTNITVKPLGLFEYAIWGAKAVSE